jgi:hypothetical protein
MLPEIIAQEKLKNGHILHEGLHLQCGCEDHENHYAMLSKTVAVGNSPANGGPHDGVLVTPIRIRDAAGEHVRWDKGSVVKPLEAPFNCPNCNQPLHIG